MAVDPHADDDSAPGPEQGLICVLDTGCNVACHGDRWLQRYLQLTRQEEPALEADQGGGFRGIGGRVHTLGTRELSLCLELAGGGLAHGELRSVELSESDAPLLLSLEAQRRLGLVLDLSREIAHSQALDRDLRLVVRNVLLNLRLLPGSLAYYNYLLEHDQDSLDGDSEQGDVDNGGEHGPEDNDYDRYEEEGDEPSSVDVGMEPEYPGVYHGYDIGALHHIEQEFPGDNDIHDHVFDDNGGLSDSEVADVGFLAIDEMRSKHMTSKQAQAVKNNMGEPKKKDRLVWNRLCPNEARRRPALPRGCKTFLFEIFAGCAMLSTLAHYAGLPVSEPFDILYDPMYDLQTKEGRAMVESRIAADDPYLVTFAPVCGPWSQHVEECRA